MRIILVAEVRVSGMKKKDAIYVTVIALCLVLVGVILLKRRSQSGGIESIPNGDMIFVKCTNPDCKAEYQTSMREYFRYVEEHTDPISQTPTPVICEECGKESVYRAVKCEHCGSVFFYGAVHQDSFEDRCPKCGYSKIEKNRKEAAGRRSKS